MNYLLIPAGIVGYLIVGAVVACTTSAADGSDFSDDSRDVVIVLSWPLFLVFVIVLGVGHGAPTLALRAVDAVIDWHRAQVLAREIAKAELPRATARRR